MHRLIKNSLLVALIALSTAALASAAEPITNLVKDGKGYKAEKVFDFPAKSGGKLELSKVIGDISIESWTENKVKIVQSFRISASSQQDAEKLLQNYSISAESRGDAIIASGPGNYRGNVGVAFKVYIPRKFSLDASTSGGDFILKDLSGDNKIKTSGGDVSVYDCDGSLNAETSGGDVVLKRVKGVVSAVTSGGDMNCVDCGEKISLRTSGGDIEIARIEGDIDAKTSGGEVNAVDINGFCSLKTSGGDVSIARITSKRKIQASTSGGDMDVAQIQGDISLQTSGGDLNINTVSGLLEASTSGGEITVSASAGPMKLSTSGGNIDISGAESAVEASTSGGDINLIVAKTFATRDQHITLSSSGGDIDLTLPADFKGSLQAVIKLYNSRYDEYEIYSDFAMKISKESAAESKSKKRGDYFGQILAQGDINGGGNPVSLETSNGDISIHRK